MNVIWNAHVEVSKAHPPNTVALGWGVTDDVSGDPLDYHADITLTLPPRAAGTIKKKAPNETVFLNRDASLTCGPNTMEAIATYRVSPKNAGANGKVVDVKVATNAAQKAPPSGGILGQATGRVGQDISVRLVIPGSCG